MTVIVWDGKTLAADRQCTSCGHTFSVTKVFRVGADMLVGFAGNGSRLGVYREWLERGAVPSQYPVQIDNQSLHMLVILRDGRIHKYESSGYPIPVEESYHAMGSGRDYALAAVVLGFDSERAVAVASQLCEECGRGCDALTFADSG